MSSSSLACLMNLRVTFICLSAACPARHVFTVHCHDQHTVSPPQRRVFFLFPDSFSLEMAVLCFWGLLFTFLAFSADKLVLVLRTVRALPHCVPPRYAPHVHQKVFQQSPVAFPCEAELLCERSVFHCADRTPPLKSCSICCCGDASPVHCWFKVLLRRNAAAVSVIGSDRTLASDGFAKCGWLFQHETTAHVCDRLSRPAAQPSPSRPMEPCHVYPNLSVLFCTASFCRQ